MVDKALFSSVRVDWGAPQEFFDKLDRIYKFTIDIAADSDNAKCPNFIDKETDALEVIESGTGYWAKWIGTVWCNPPYGKEVGEWIYGGLMAVEERYADQVVLLLPARTDTKWFHRYAPYSEIRLIKGRLRFEGAPSSAPFPSMLMIFGSENTGTIRTMEQ